MSHYPTIQLGQIMAKRTGTINPAKFPEEIFDLYSIPAYDAGRSQLTPGSAIGSSKQIVQPGDVLLSKIVPHIRRAWVVGDSVGKRMVASSEWIVFRSQEVHPPYLRHLLTSDQFHVQFMNTVAGVGGSLLRARPAFVADIDIPLPSLDEQRRIAEVLDQVDRLRVRRQQAVALFDGLIQSIFLDMFGIVDERGAQWPIKTVEEICVLVVDCVNRTAPTVDYETPYKMIRTTNVKQGKINLSDVRYVERETYLRWNRRATPAIGDVILTREAPVGEAGILKAPDQVFLGQRLMLYRVNPDIATSEYLLAAFRSPFLRRQFDKHGSGSTVKHLPLPVCRGFEIPTPPLHLQQEFARRVESIENLRRAHLAQLDELDTLFASVQQRALCGKLWKN